MPKTLETIELTNGEHARVILMADFLAFMKQESAPLPVSGDELDALLTRYIIRERKDSMKKCQQYRSAVK